ncbi:DivIVA domain-containing protein [Micromonospora sp. DT233]|uniref:DivIVA domain-containing protein n=1 Tax=Micromonospora sp. DT233 TaxID=3393432 RepID=UPI003CF91B47
MGQVLLLLVVALTVAAVVFGVTVLVTGRDPGLVPVEPDGRAVPLPGNRPLHESDVGDVRFDTTLRGYRMAQVDQAMRRAAYDIGYKSELIGVLEAEVTALREGRTADADALARAREQAAAEAAAGEDGQPGPADATVPADATGSGSVPTGLGGGVTGPAGATTGAGSGAQSAGTTEGDGAPAGASDAGEPVDPAGERGPAVRSEPA